MNIKVDILPHIRNGMTILSNMDITMRPKDIKVEWPQDKLFNPIGISIKEARIAMQKCK